MGKRQNKTEGLFNEIKRRYLLLLNDSIVKSNIHEIRSPYYDYQSVHRAFSNYKYFHDLKPIQQVSLVNFVLDNNLGQYAGFRDNVNNELMFFYKNKDVFNKVRNHLLDITKIDYSFISSEALSFLGREVVIAEEIHPLIRKGAYVPYQGGLTGDEHLYRFQSLSKEILEKTKESPYTKYLNGFDSSFVLGYNPEKHCFYIVRCRYNGLILSFGTEIVAVAVYVKSSFSFYEKNVLPSFEKYYKNTYG